MCSPKKPTSDPAAEARAREAQRQASMAAARLEQQKVIDAENERRRIQAEKDAAEAHQKAVAQASAKPAAMRSNNQGSKRDASQKRSLRIRATRPQGPTALDAGGGIGL